MNFLTKFLQILAVALIFSALGAYVFYKAIISGNSLAPGVSEDDFRRTVTIILGALAGFIILVSAVLAFTGMKSAITVPVHDPAAFPHRVTAAVTGLRYRPLSQSDGLLVFKPPVIGGLMAEKIRVQMGQGFATITGPRGLLRKLEGRLR